MRRLIEGGESEKRIELFLQLTSIKSEVQIRNLKRHFVNGWSEEHLGAAGVDIGNFRRAVKTLNNVVAIHDALNELADEERKSVK